MNAIGDFVPPPPPCFFTTMKNNICFKRKKVNLVESANSDEIRMICDHLFNTNEKNPSISIRNSLELLNQIIAMHDAFNSLTLKNYLKLGNVEKANEILLSTNPTDKDYLNNMMLAALYSSNLKNNNYESLQTVVKNLMANNLFNEALNILLLTKNIHQAAKLLFKYGRINEAYQILMLNDQKEIFENDKKIVQKVACSLINKEKPLYGMKLLASFGENSEMINQLSAHLL